MTKSTASVALAVATAAGATASSAPAIAQENIGELSPITIDSSESTVVVPEPSYVDYEVSSGDYISVDEEDSVLATKRWEKKDTISVDVEQAYSDTVVEYFLPPVPEGWTYTIKGLPRGADFDPDSGDVFIPRGNVGMWTVTVTMTPPSALDVLPLRDGSYAVHATNPGIYYVPTIVHEEPSSIVIRAI